MIVVDSSVWIAHLADVVTPPVALFRDIDDVENILVGDIISLELLRGARSERDARLIREKLALYAQAQMLSTELAETAAANYRLLRRNGITIRSIADLIIGTYCVTHGHTILHHDRDFSAMEELMGVVPYRP